ncbi:MAG TPA: PAS domain-containing protein [Chitinophagaceae bacterium]|jgi:PAS domain S-box-containing protein|nr:PAS domain-containing protein [Chitinophagaceae bacterium]
MGERYIEDFKLDTKNKSDKLMDYFLPGFFGLGFIFAFYYETWMIAIAVGGLSLLAYYSVKFFLPASDLYQYVLSAVIGIFMAQYIYQMHGMFEMHFFAFIGSTILVTYRKWQLQIPIAIVVFVHHAGFGYLQFIGVEEIHFTQLDYMTLQTFIIHILLAIGIFSLCGLWSWRFKVSGEQQVAQSLELQRIFNTVEDVMFSQDAVNRRTLQVSSACKKVYGYTPADFIEDSDLWIKLIHPEDSHMVENIRQELREGKTIKKRFRIIHKNQSIRWIEAKLIPTLNKKGEWIRTDGVCTDITHLIRLEKKLNLQRKEKQYQITSAVITAQEKERMFLGQELHDNINPLLATVQLYMDCAANNIDQRVSLLKESKTLINTAVEEIRAISNSLIPKPFNQISLKEAISDVCKNINKASDLQFIADWDNVDDSSLSDQMKLTIFRIVQEQITNIIKHANAKEVIIEIYQDKGVLILNIKDDGAGFDLSSKRNGVGLQNISSRAELLDGQVIINSSPGNGCELQVIFDYDEIMVRSNRA